MMVMEGSKMSKKEYDLTAIMYSAYDTSHKLVTGHIGNSWNLACAFHESMGLLSDT